YACPAPGSENDHALLQVALDLIDRPWRGAARILAELPPGPALPQQVPALIKLRLDSPELLLLLVSGQLSGGEPGPQAMLGLNQIIDVAEDFLVVHLMVLPRGFAHPCIPSGQRCGGVGRTGYGRDMQLTRRRIINVAIELIEAEGVEKVSMQRLAT